MAFACACLSLAVAAGSASAAATWLPPTDISAANELIDGRPKVAVDDTGNAVAIWERHVGGKLVVEANERPAGGEWSAPERVSGPNEEGRESQVAIDDAGNAYAVWVEEGFSTISVIRSAVRPAGGEWSVPENLSPPFQGPPEVVLAAAAGAVAAWTIDNGPERIVQAAVRPGGDGWEDPKDLCRMPAPDPGPQLAAVGDVGINAAGEAVAVWQCYDGSNKIVQAAAHPPGGEWSQPDDLSAPGGDAHEPQVAIDPAGDAVATWNRWDSTASALIVQAAVRQAGAWSAPEDLSEAHLSANAAPVAIDAAGNAVAVWLHPDDNINQAILQAAVRPAEGQWSAPEDLSAAGQRANNPAVAMNDTVGAIATWQQSDGAGSRVQASVRPPGGEWSQPENLSAAGEGAGLPDLALDAVGNGIAVFGRVGEDGPFAQAAGYDFAGPRIDALQIPATGTVGEPIAFSVSPFDMFLAGTSWAFGDGQGAGGNTVSHVYTAPGTYPVTVSALDGAGNATTQTAAILIVPPNSPPPPGCKIALSIAIQGESPAKLLRTGKLGVNTTVSCAAKVVLSGRAKLRVHVGGQSQTKLVSIFKRKVARFAAAGERRVTLSLSKRGRKALRPLSRVSLSIAGEASDGAGSVATATTARALQAETNALKRRSGSRLVSTP